MKIENMLQRFSCISFLLKPWFNKLQSVDKNILSKDDSSILKVLLFGDHSFNDLKNTFIFNCFNLIHNFNKTFSCSSP